MGQDANETAASTPTLMTSNSDVGLSPDSIAAECEDVPSPLPLTKLPMRLPKLSFEPLSASDDHDNSSSSFASDIIVQPHDFDVVTDDSEEAASDQSFRARETTRRSRNLRVSISRSARNLRKRDSARVLVTCLKATRLFLSHCWRDVDIKPKKKEMFSYLTEKGCVFWADFLDLHDEGAVEWRKEIEEAIHGCNKFIAFIDLQYLLSFNCMEEMAFAIREQKPIVLSILDQDAWNLITSRGGAGEAWNLQPRTGLALSSFEGKSMGSDVMEPFSLKTLEEIFSALSNINFCPCRELDFQLEGTDRVHKRLYRFTVKDLDYAKEFADLKQKAAAWEATGRPKGLLTSWKDAREWGQWIDVADKAEAQPVPTEQQRTYVQVSMKQTKKKGKIRLAALAVAMILILMGAVAAVVMAFRAEKQREVAEDLRTLAEEQRALAEQQRAFAEEQRAEAEYHGAVASILLLSADQMPCTTAGIRAQTMAADLAGSFSTPEVVLPALHGTLRYLIGKPYQFLDLVGHRAQINSVDFSPSESSLVSSSKDGQIIVWPISWDDSALVPELVDPAIVPGGLDETDRCVIAKWMTDDTFAAAFEGGGFQVWQKDAGGSWRVELSAKPHKKKILVMALSGDGSRVATSDKKNMVALWSFNENSPLSEASVQVFSISERIYSMVFSPDGRYLILGYPNGVLAYCSVRGGPADTDQDPQITDLMVLPSTENVEALAFSPGGRWLAAGFSDGTAHVIGWNEISISSSKVMFSISSPAPMMSSFKAVVGLTWSSETSLLIAEDVGSVSIWEVPQGDEEADREPFLQHQLVYQTSKSATSAPIPVTGVAFSSKIGRGTIAMSSEESMLRLWFPTPQLGHRGPLGFRLQIYPDYPSEITAVAWSRTRMAACSNQGGLGIWESNPATGVWYQAATFPVGDDRKGQCRSLAWAPDGSMIAAGTIGATVEVWQMQQDGDWLRAMRGATAGDVRRNPSFSPDSRWLAVPGKKSPEIWLFHVLSQPPPDPKDEVLRQPDHVLKHPEGEIKSIAWAPFSPSGAGDLLLASSGEDSTRLWDLSEVITAESPSLAVQGITTLDITFQYATRMDWSADGRLLAMSHEGVGQVWHWPGGRVDDALNEDGGWAAQMSVEGHTGVLGSVSWSPDGSQVVIPYDDNSLRIYHMDGEAGQAKMYYQIEHKCEWLNWKTVSIGDERGAHRIACANTAGAAAVEGEKFDFAFELLMVDFEEQRQLLQNMTYGRLTGRDLQILRLERLEAQVLPEIADKRN